MEFDYALYPLSESFYRRYPKDLFPEILTNPKCAYSCVLVDLKDYWIAIPYRTNISHRRTAALKRPIEMDPDSTIRKSFFWIGTSPSTGNPSFWLIRLNFAKPERISKRLWDRRCNTWNFISLSNKKWVPFLTAKISTCSNILRSSIFTRYRGSILHPPLKNLRPIGILN